MSTTPLTPEVLWAQRSSQTDPEKNLVFLTIHAADLDTDSLKLSLTSTNLSFSGKNKTREFSLELEFFAEIDEKASKTHRSGRGIEFILRKKEATEKFWPRLSKDTRRLQFIKTDFEKWVDEDEQDGAEETVDLSAGGGGGMPSDMGGIDFAKMMGSMGSGSNLDMESMMSAAAGGAGGAADDADDADDDEDMPELEDTSEIVTNEKEDTPKIEEV